IRFRRGHASQDKPWQRGTDRQRSHRGFTDTSRSRTMGRVLIAAVVLIVLSVVLGAVAFAALTENLPRNRWVGVRTAKSLGSAQNFAMVNKVAAPMVLVGALSWLLGGLAALRLDGVAGVVIIALAAV